MSGRGSIRQKKRGIPARQQTGAVSARARKTRGYSRTLNTSFRKRGVKQPRPLSIGSLPQRSQLTRDRAVHVISAMHRDPTLSLARAAKSQGIKAETVKKYFPSALKKSNGRVRVTKSDRLSVTLYVPDAGGNPVPIVTSSYRDRRQVSRYLRDLGRYLRGERDALAPWHGKKIAGVELVTDSGTLRAIEPALPGFSPYRVINGA
jgi:hypothetical protein